MMPVGWTVNGHTSSSIKARLLYAPVPQSAPAATTKPAASTPVIATASSEAVVQISAEARAASDALSAQRAEQGTAPSLKARVDAMFEAAKSRGSQVTFDLANPGEPPDFSGFTDDEVAKIALDKGGEYPKGLSDWAAGALTARVKESLEPYESAVWSGDRRGHATAIRALYDQMSPDTRSALGWTPAMMAANDSMLEGDTRQYGAIDRRSIWHSLAAASHNGGITFDEPPSPLSAQIYSRG